MPMAVFNDKRHNPMVANNVDGTNVENITVIKDVSQMPLDAGKRA